jgi:hypothetical protein
VVRAVVVAAPAVVVAGLVAMTTVIVAGLGVAAVVIPLVVVVTVVVVLTLMVAGRVVGAVAGERGSGAADGDHDCDGEGRCASLEHFCLLGRVVPDRAVGLIRVSPGIRRVFVAGSTRFAT